MEKDFVKEGIEPEMRVCQSKEGYYIGCFYMDKESKEEVFYGRVSEYYAHRKDALALIDAETWMKDVGEGH